MTKIDEVIRGELFVVKSTDTNLAVIKNLPDKDQRYSIHHEHAHTAIKLGPFPGAGVKEVLWSSGSRSILSNSFGGGTSFFKDMIAFGLIKMSEEHAVNQYREAIKSKELDQNLQRLIEIDLLIAQEEDLKTVDIYLQ
jgi:hypothetical protein